MPDDNFKRNHYVPVWYQRRFIPDDFKEQKYYYLDLNPQIRTSGNHQYKRNSVLRWGPKGCFCEDDLYTTKFGKWESREIEKEFFGVIERLGFSAIDYFTNFEHPSANGDMLNAFVPYMSIQKLRTIKGINNLSKIADISNKNLVLYTLQNLQNIYCAIWSECVWCIADASNSDTKFIISDHPVTIYNQACFPESKWCRGINDPDIRCVGSHTIFPLSLNKILLLTNLSWARDPYQNPLNVRPNPNYFRTTLFNFMQIQTRRMLSEYEVNEINYIIKKRAYRYIAAGKKEWLYPEKNITSTNWTNFGVKYLLMPDPRSMIFSSEVTIGYSNKKYDWFDPYGRKPWQRDYDDKELHEKEWLTFNAFRGEYARKFGPRRRGVSCEFNRPEPLEDSADYHKSLMEGENYHKQKLKELIRSRKNKKSS